MVRNYSDYKQLNEVKKDQEGTGLLIENDGHIFNQCDTVSQIKEDIDAGHNFVVPEHFVLPALFQKYNVKNANGRIYPEAVLRKQVDVFIRDRVNNHCAIGALDHPACQLENTSILTEGGWKNIKEVKEGDNIYTLNTENKTIETREVLKKIEEPYKGEIVSIKGSFVDLEVTPLHKFPVYDESGNFKGFYTAEQIYGNEIPEQEHSYIPKTGEWQGDDDSTFIIPALEGYELMDIPDETIKEELSQPKTIPMTAWAKLMAAYATSGNVNAEAKCVLINNVNKELLPEMDTMLAETSLEWLCCPDKMGIGYDVECDTYTYIIEDPRLVSHLQQLERSSHGKKRVPSEIKRQNKRTLGLFYDWFTMTGGNISSKELALDINEIQFKIGFNGYYHETEQGGNTIFRSDRTHNQAICLNLNHLSVTKRHYDGMVYCVEVERHNFYTMDKSGYTLWSGNSSSLSGHDVAMNIINLYWKNQTLMGELELILSEGFRRTGVCSTSGDLVATYIMNGIQLGVSSRGVGSVKRQGDVLLVDNDYEIICWDVVCEPSTPNAWIKNSVEELMPFVESEERNDLPINEKLTRIERILG